jgi:hypothetical protein
METVSENPAPEGVTEVPLHRQICWIARELWEKAGCPEGRDQQIWREAKKIVRRSHLVPASYRCAA